MLRLVIILLTFLPLSKLLSPDTLIRHSIHMAPKLWFKYVRGLCESLIQKINRRYSHRSGSLLRVLNHWSDLSGRFLTRNISQRPENNDHKVTLTNPSGIFKTTDVSTWERVHRHIFEAYFNIYINLDSRLRINVTIMDLYFGSASVQKCHFGGVLISSKFNRSEFFYKYCSSFSGFSVYPPYPSVSLHLKRNVLVFFNFTFLYEVIDSNIIVSTIDQKFSSALRPMHSVFLQGNISFKSYHIMAPQAQLHCI